MTPSFDPYYTWLGIRPEEQPPNHYRLLGLQLFEDNVDAIEHAADRQMAHLRTLQTGKHAESSQKLLNEVAAAKVCLLNAQKKAAYDATLRDQLSSQVASVPAAEPLIDPSLAALLEGGKAEPLTTMAAPRLGRRQTTATLYLLVAAIAVVVVILGMLLWPRPANQTPSPTTAPRQPEAPTAQPAEPKRPEASAPTSETAKPAPATPNEPPPPVSTANSPAASSPPTAPLSGECLPIGQWVDVLQYADLEWGRAYGDWSRQPEGIVSALSTNDAMSPRLALPVEITGSYDIEVELTRHDRDRSVGVVFPVGRHRAVLRCDLTQRGSPLSGLDRVDGQHAMNNTTTRHGAALATGQRARITIQVRLEGDRASIDTLINGKPFIQWAGLQESFSATAKHWSLPGENPLGLTNNLCKATFHAVRLRMISGQAIVTKPIQSVAAPVPAAHEETIPLGDWVDVLKSADLAWGRVHGDWTRQGEAVVSGLAGFAPKLGNPRLALPVEIAGSYDLQVEFTRDKGDQMVGLVFPVGAKRVVLQIDCHGGVSGLEWVDRQPLWSNPTAKNGAVLTTGQRQAVSVQVRLAGEQASIAVRLNDKPFLEWKGEQEALSSIPPWNLPGKNPLGLTNSRCQVTFHSVRLRLQSGTAVVTKGPPVNTASVESKPGEPAPANPETKSETRLPVPTSADQEKALGQLDEVYKLKQSRTAAQKNVLAKELLGLSRQPGSTPAEPFVLLHTAMEQARDGGDLDVMLEAVEAITTQFDVETLNARAKALAQFAKNAPEGSALKGFAAAADRTIEQALADNRYELAMELAEEAYRLGQKPQGKEFRKQTYDRRNAVKKLYDRRREIEQTLASLKATPEDPALNLAAGRWYCFEKGDWRQGLSCLMKGSDEKLKALAQQELASPPREPADQVKLADAWFDLAQTMAGKPKDETLLHAGAWYRQAELSGISGLLATKVSQRLKDIGRLGRPIPDFPAGEPQSGKELPVGEWGNVLKWADVERGRAAGKWARHGEEIIASDSLWTRAEGHSRLALPVDVEGDYDLRVEFTRTKNPVMVGAILPVGSHQVAMAFDQGAPDDKASGLELIDGRGLRGNPTTKRGPAVLTNGQRHMVLHQVRLEGDRVRVEVFLDGQPFLQWVGPQASLMPQGSQYALPGKNPPGLIASSCDVTFHAVWLRLVSGKATRGDVAGKTP